MNLSTATARSSGSYPANSAALTRPPKNASSAAAVAAATCLYNNRDSLISTVSSQKVLTATTTISAPESLKISKAPPPPPPPSQHMPQQYARHFPMLPNSNVQSISSAIGTDQASSTAYFTTPLEVSAATSQRPFQEDITTKSMINSNSFFPSNPLQQQQQTKPTSTSNNVSANFSDNTRMSQVSHKNLILTSIAENTSSSTKNSTQNCPNNKSHENYKHVNKENAFHEETNFPVSTSSVSPFLKQPMFNFIPATKNHSNNNREVLPFSTATTQSSNSCCDISRQITSPLITAATKSQPQHAEASEEALNSYEPQQYFYEKPASLNYLEHYANVPPQLQALTSPVYASEKDYEKSHLNETSAVQYHSPTIQAQGLGYRYMTTLITSPQYQMQQQPLQSSSIPVEANASEEKKFVATTSSSNSNNIEMQNPSRSNDLLSRGKQQNKDIFRFVEQTSSVLTISNNNDVQSGSKQSSRKPSQNNVDAMALTGSSGSLPVSRHVDDQQSGDERGESSESDHDETSFMDNDALASLPAECKLKIRAVISGWRAGTIIGRQGAVINALRQDSNCRITMSDDPTSPDRTLSILGHPYEVANVLDRVCYLLKTPSVRQQKSGDLTEEINNGYSSSGTAAATYGSNINFTLAVPSPLCGCLIGRKGVQIREFRQRFNVSFSVSATPIQESNDRPVVVSGTPKNVSLCLREVCLLLAQTPRVQRESQEESTRPEDSGTGGLFQSSWKRALSSAGGVYMHGQSGDEAAGNVEDDERYATLAPSIGRSQHRRPRHGGSLPGASKGSRRGAPRNNNYRGGGGTSGEESNSHNYSFHDNEEKLGGNSICEYSFTLSNGETEVHLLVPNDIVGCIIGRAGKTISGIREASGAYISITDGTFPPRTPINAISTITSPQSIQRSSSSRGTQRDRVILIRGGSANVRHARYMMGSSILNAQGGGRNPSLSPATSLADFTRS